jgi:hypothetical protein
VSPLQCRGGLCATAADGIRHQDMGFERTWVAVRTWGGTVVSQKKDRTSVRAAGEDTPRTGVAAGYTIPFGPVPHLPVAATQSQSRQFHQFCGHQALLRWCDTSGGAPEQQSTEACNQFHRLPISMGMGRWGLSRAYAVQ